MRIPIISIVLIALVISSFHCHKSSSSCYSYNPPSSFFFIIKQNGKRLPDTILQNVKLSYFENGIKKYISDVSGATDYYANKGILTTRTIGIQSADHNIKTYYLEYTGNLNTDSLYINYTSPSPTTNCLYVMQSIKFNGQQITVDTSFHYQPVYILNKQ